VLVSIVYSVNVKTFVSTGYNVENPMVNYSKLIAETASNHYNVRDEYKDNTYEQNVAISLSEQRKFSVACINITGELNIGMMIRSACLLGAENFYIFGRKKFDKRSTVGAEKYINIVQYAFDDPIHADEHILNQLKLLKHPIIACEHGGVELGTIDATNVYNSVRDAHPMFLFGSESHGIPQLILDRLDPTGYPDYEFSRISIPQRGVLRSFNVSAACNIILWDYCKEMFL
jgi:tRNA G18 (ribose-2'-O)-methylase SpoU